MAEVDSSVLVPTGVGRRLWIGGNPPDARILCLISLAIVGLAATLAGLSIVATGAFLLTLAVGLVFSLPGAPLLGGAGLLLGVDALRLLFGGSPVDDGIGGAALWILGIGLVLGCRPLATRPPSHREGSLDGCRADPRVLAAFVVVDLVVNLKILLGRGIAINGDASSPWLFRNVRNVALYMFNDAGSVTNLENVDRALYAVPVTGLVSLLHLGSGTYSKIQWLAFPLIGMVGCYLLVLHALREISVTTVRTAPVMAASFVYAFSPWVLEQVQANFYWLAYALTPFVVLVSTRLATRPTIARCLSLGLLITICGSTPQYFIFTIGISGSVLVATCLVAPAPYPAALTRLAKWLAVLTGMLLVLNASWLLPTYRVLKGGGSVSPGYSLQASDLDLFSRRSSPINILRGYDQWIFPYANDGLLRHLLDPLLVGLTALVPVTVVLLLTNRRVISAPILRMLALPTIVATTLALGTRLPFYRWLLLDAPVIRNFGWLLRVPGKLSYVLWLYVALVVAIAGNVWLSSVKPTFRHVAAGALALGVLSGIAIKTASTFYYYYVPVSQPREYGDLASYLSAQTQQGRVLYLAPYGVSFGANRLQFETSFTWNPSRVATNTPAVSSPLPSIDYYHLTYRDWQPLIGETLGQLDSATLGSDLLAKAGVGFVVYHADIVGGDEQAKSDVASLKRSDLQLCKTFGRDISVFCNRTSAPVIRGEGLSYAKVDPTKYRLSWSGKTKTSPFTFAQPFDSLWELRYGGRVVAPLPDADGYTSFEVPDEAGQATLVYAPQRFYRIGIVISGLGLVSLMLCCAFAEHMQHRRRRTEVDPTVLPEVYDHDLRRARGWGS